MGYSSFFFIIINVLIISLSSFCYTSIEAQITQKAPALYVFGDSLVDVGNNNYLTLSIAKANHFPYGVDFPTKKPTGRFSNGKNAADFIAEELGLATSPPYLSFAKSNKNNVNVSLLDGVSFASAGAGIFDGTDDRFRQSIPLRKQVDYYVEAHEEMRKEIGEDGALQSRLSKSIFGVVIGSNDIFGYFDSSTLRHNNTPQQYVDSMLSSLKAQLQRIYDYGGRKFVIAGVGAIGCCPAYRVKNKTECVKEVNDWALLYNQGLKSMLHEWQSQNQGITFSYFDTFNAINDLILNQASYGFTEVRAACCGIGELRGQGPCLVISKYCSNRDEHIFWDQYHPSQAASRLFVDKIFNGPSQYSYPINMKQLVAL